MTLISSIALLKEQANVSVKANWESFAPFAKRMEREYIVPAIGRAFYNELLSYLEGSTTDAITDELIDLLRSASAQLIVSEALSSEGLVNIKDGGAQVNNQENEPYARKWQVDQVRAKSLANAMGDIDRVLEYLEDNSSTFTTWKGSAAYTAYTDRLVYKTAVFEQYRPIGNSRLTFKALSADVFMCEKVHLVNLMSKEQYTELVDKVHASAALVAPYIDLREHAERFVVYRSLLSAVPQIAVKVSPRGITLEALEVNIEQNQTSKPADAASRELLMSDLEDKARDAASRLKAYLEANADDLPLYKASSSYVGTSSSKWDNSNKAIFIL